jgi:phosphinothricin acetyltransferase
MEIRDAKEKDIEKINEIYNKAIKNLTVTFETGPLSLEEQAKWYKKHKEEDYPIIVAEKNEEVLGWASLSKWSEKEGYKYTVENSVYVDSKNRNKGIGKKLLEKLISKAHKREFKNIIALITEGNEVSIILHERFDFEKVGTLNKVGYKFDKFIDVDLFQLRLDD